jgi:hypothetical protein
VPGSIRHESMNASTSSSFSRMTRPNRYVEASDHRTGIEGAEAAARSTVSAHGRNPDKARITGPTSAAAFARCNHVSFTVSYSVPALTLPFIGGLGSGVVVRSTQSEVVDPFRNDVPGEAVCGG